MLGWLELVRHSKKHTLHTNVFVSPVLSIGLWQSFGLSDRDHIFIPPAKHKQIKCRCMKTAQFYTDNIKVNPFNSGDEKMPQNPAISVEFLIADTSPAGHASLN